jgi:peptide/nickel transport system substrate-binding protein
MKKSALRALSALPWYLRVCFMVALFVATVTSFLLIAKQGERYLVEIPRAGGTLTEGIIGRPRFINPVIAKSDADRDMVQLVYSGLMKATPDGTLIPEMAESYEVSEDGLTYTFTLREGLVWHDGTPISSEDILFTIEKIRDSALAIKSPKRASWEGVTVETPSAREIVFRITQPYAPFLENATMGIIPKHIWKDVPDDEFDVSYYNIEPIGSGPYRVTNIVRDDNKGLPRHYELVAFPRYALGEPYITNLIIQFFGNDLELLQAYNDRTVDQIHTLEPAQAQIMERAGGTITTTPLPRIFAAFFNQSQKPIFADVDVRKALALATDRQGIVQDVLLGYGTIETGALPFPFLMSTSSEVLTQAGSTTPEITPSNKEERIAAARTLLEDAGWQQNVAGIYEKTDKVKKQVALLEFSIAIPDVPELRQAAEILKRDWEAVGASVTLKVYDTSTFTTEILLPRKYDVLFYGQVISRVPDPYAYWHSSQRNAPGLNVALYLNKNADKILENARKETNDEKRNALLREFVDVIEHDVPAVFIYSPDFLYATAPKVRGIEVGLITTESERFLNIPDWYIDSERVWKWFADRTSR